MLEKDKSLDHLLDLDGITMVVDGVKGLWVKFDVKKVDVSESKPHGIKFSLTLHDRKQNRILGIDNAHDIEYGGKNKPKIAHYHWHKDIHDAGTPYHFIDTGKLLEDFWKEVDSALNKFEEALK